MGDEAEYLSDLYDGEFYAEQDFFADTCANYNGTGYCKGCQYKNECPASEVKFDGLPAIWKCKDGREIPIDKMNPTHIKNAIRLLEKRSPKPVKLIQALKAELPNAIERSTAKAKAKAAEHDMNFATQYGLGLKSISETMKERGVAEKKPAAKKASKEIKTQTPNVLKVSDRDRLSLALAATGINFTQDGDKICISPEEVNGAGQEICLQFHEDGKFQEFIVYNLK